MIRTTVITIALLAATPVFAQQSTCVTTCNNGVCVSTCTQNNPIPLHRPNPEAERAFRAEQNYYDRAYEYELNRLDQENRRR
jgi:hypothetical protein